MTTEQKQLFAALDAFTSDTIKKENLSVGAGISRCYGTVLSWLINTGQTPDEITEKTRSTMEMIKRTWTQNPQN